MSSFFPRRPSEPTPGRSPSPPPHAVPVHSEEFRRAIESIKLRAPIEEVVRERVPGLKKSGALWVACCPFHDEKTPSFKVDPRRGTWRCYGACGTGGDQISFLERFDNIPFIEVLELLAARTGVELPRKSGPDRHARESEDEPLLRALQFAERFYVRALSTSEGRAALEYVRGRGLHPDVIQSFGVGYAPAGGQALLHAARAEGLEFAALEAAGLARQNEQGRSYDFFRGRMTIPIRDREGRPVGFGARRLDDGDESGPKYVNTPETRVFHKGRLVYALDKALAQVRRSGHIVLMEGYTDVMAAHQVGLTQCVAVLGTATTEDHAALIRRSGARRITLLFDGDEAGRKAAWKALTGLLHLEIAIDVVALGGGDDPCDVLVREGAAPLLAQFELARDWFDFVCDGLAGLRGVELSRAVDQVLELLARLPRPVLRESLVQDLSRRIGISVGALREQWRATHSRTPRPARRDAAAPVAKPAAEPAFPPRVRESIGRLLGALVLDPSLVPLARGTREQCLDAELAAIFDALLALYSDENAVIDEHALLALLGEHPAHHKVVPLVEEARTAESPRELVEGELRFLEAVERRRQAELVLAEARRLDAEHAASAAPGDARDTERPDELFQRETALDAQPRGLAAS